MKKATHSYQSMSSFSPQKRRRENANNESRLAKSESKSVFTQLTRSTSLLTWATYDSFLSGGGINDKSMDSSQEERESCPILQCRERSSTFCSSNVGGGVILEEDEQVDLDCENQQLLEEDNSTERNEVPLKWITATTTNLVKRMSLVGLSSLSSTTTPATNMPATNTREQEIGLSKKVDPQSTSLKEKEHLRPRVHTIHYGSTSSSSDLSTSSLEPQNSNDDLSQCSFFTRCVYQSFYTEKLCPCNLNIFFNHCSCLR